MKKLTNEERFCLIGMLSTWAEYLRNDQDEHTAVDMEVIIDQYLNEKFTTEYIEQLHEQMSRLDAEITEQGKIIEDLNRNYEDLCEESVRPTL